jgi:diketogulonate reductase-like aldo/keto reductase
MITPSVTLRSGLKLPALGFGTWPFRNAEAESAVGQALAAGYRLIDTATKYGNETGVGRAIARSGLPRDQIVVQSKLRGGDQGAFFTPRAVDASLANLGLDYLDLYLIHWPLPRLDLYVDTWRALAEAQQAGLIRAIGVSNFQPAHLDRLIAETGVIPEVNQIELHPYFVQADVVAHGAAHGIVTEAWGPLGQGKTGVLEDPVILDIARRADAKPAQVVLAWHIARGVVPLPKSADPARMADNLAAASLRLSPDQVAAITALNRPEGRIFDAPDEHDER